MPARQYPQVSNFLYIDLTFGNIFSINAYLKIWACLYIANMILIFDLLFWGGCLNFGSMLALSFVLDALRFCLLFRLVFILMNSIFIVLSIFSSYVTDYPVIQPTMISISSIFWHLHLVLCTIHHVSSISNKRNMNRILRIIPSRSDRMVVGQVSVIGRNIGIFSNKRKGQWSKE